MKAIAQFEEFLEGLVEGSFRRLFGGRLEPVDLARRLGRVMDDNKRVTWDRPLVPNCYQITLAEPDYGDVSGFVASLAKELEKFAHERAAERGYQMTGPAEVTMSSDGGLQTGTFHVRATLTDAPVRPRDEVAQPADTIGPAPAAEDFSQTRAMRPLEMPLGPTGFESLFLAGSVAGRQIAWPLAGGHVTIGRGLDNDIVLDDASVSRNHAELTREGGRMQVRDLGSRNGTWLNAARITVAGVSAGDQLAFGAVQLEVTRRAA
ncbi:MAG: FhaA domain-containing protein [Chloroflexota bacterium]